MVEKIKWMIAHEPVDLFLRTANSFGEELKRLTNGRYEVEVILEKRFSKRKQLAPMIQKNEVQMGQVVSYAAGLELLDLPYLFRDHDHASAVLDGKIGKNLLEHAGKKLPGVKGLAFTYSGGFRIIWSKKPVSSASDLRNIKIGIPDPGSNNKSPSRDAMEKMNFQAVLQEVSDSGEILYSPEDYDGMETTFPRVVVELGKYDNSYIVDLKHSLFLTAVLANKEWFSSLDSDIQDAVEQAIAHAAREERAWSIQDAEDVKRKAKELNVVIYDPSQEEVAELKSLTADVYLGYPSWRRAIDAIRAV